MRINSWKFSFCVLLHQLWTFGKSELYSRDFSTHERRLIQKIHWCSVLKTQQTLKNFYSTLHEANKYILSDKRQLVSSYNLAFVQKNGPHVLDFSTNLTFRDVTTQHFIFYVNYVAHVWLLWSSKFISEDFCGNQRSFIELFHTSWRSFLFYIQSLNIAQ